MKSPPDGSQTKEKISLDEVSKGGVTSGTMEILLEGVLNDGDTVTIFFSNFFPFFLDLSLCTKKRNQNNGEREREEL